jgi:4-hydroxy-tetrahydrodipicolinate reductase
VTATGQALLISGLPGPMAAEVAALAAATPGFELLPFGLTSAARHGTTCAVDGREFRLLDRDRAPSDLPEHTVAVDYSTPGAALDNARWFVARRLPFVMGTTGFDPAELEPLLARANLPAVVAPNMAPPIVLLQAALRWLAAEFPGACADASLTVRESHQQGKRDTSGTAKALVRAFRALGVDFDIEGIERIRDPARQQAELDVPRGFLDAHAFHRYVLGSAGGTVRVALEHDVLGRRIYAEGTLRAVRFLQARGAVGRLFTMEEVLRGAQPAAQGAGRSRR